MFKAHLAYPAFQAAFGYHFPLVDIEEADLVIFSGGEDINPDIYGEKNVASMGINKYRDAVEIEVYKKAKALGKKMLGVCRGHQLLMALSGGKLVQDIFPGHPGDHEVEVLMEGVPLLRHVNSLHHQGIKPQDVPKGFYITSIYNGIVESTVSDDILTVQWHPEFLEYGHGKTFFDMVREWARG